MTDKTRIFQVQTVATDYNDEYVLTHESEGVIVDNKVYATKEDAEKVAVELRRQMAVEILGDPDTYQVEEADDKAKAAYWEAFRNRLPDEDEDDIESHMVAVSNSLDDGPPLTDAEAQAVCDLFCHGYVTVVELERA